MQKNQPQISQEQQRAEEMLFNEAVENMHNEQLISFWKKYKFLVYGTAVLIILSVAGFEAYKAYRTKTLLKASDQYENAAVLNAKGKTQNAVDEYAALKNSPTNYKYLSMLRQAGIFLEQHEDKKALDLLRSLYEDKDVPESLRAIAVFGAASRLVETEDPASVHKMIAPYLVATNSFYGTAVELESVLLMRQGKYQEAISLIDQALTVSSVPAKTKEHLNILRDVLAER